MPEAVRQHRALARTPDEAHPSPQPCTPNLHLTTSETAALGVRPCSVRDRLDRGVGEQAEDAVGSAGAPEPRAQPAGMSRSSPASLGLYGKP